MRTIYDYLKSEWAVLKQAPLAFIFSLSWRGGWNQPSPRGGDLPKIRDACFSFRARNEKLKADTALDKKGRGERWVALMKETSDDFDRRLRGEAVNLDNELRRRLGPSAAASIVGVPPSFYSASDGAAIGVHSLVTTGGTRMSINFACVFADGIEQMTFCRRNR